MPDALTPDAATPPVVHPRWAKAAALLPPAARDALPALLLIPHALITRPAHETWAAAALTAALTLPLVRRRHAPRTVFAAVAAAALLQWLAGVQLPADIALLIALHTLAARTGHRTTLAGAAVLEAGALLACLRWTTDGAFLASFTAATATVVATAALGAGARTTRAYLAALEERTIRLEREHHQQARLAAAEERTRIAREIHDIVTHNLSVMVALTDAAAHTRPTPPDRTTTTLIQVAETGRQALTDMRRTLGILHTDQPDQPDQPGEPDHTDHTDQPGEPDAERHPLPGIAQLPALTDRMRATGLPTTLHLSGEHTPVPATAQLTVYRLVQEALTNTLKHTPAGTRATVRIHCTPHTVTLDITDDGPHHPDPHRAPRAPAGHGIPGMRERCAAYGATLHTGPREEGGWHVHTRLTLDTTRAPAPA
ncbi:sensor histidine kinase [Kitasatospora sp. NPDC051170]|uniref:sensor histidine kinase n=1 Tax=Kitasatospora sp. NPDC051170 TaxID=3364056 RepID=UPI0037B41703